jgi:hypothetical protein
MAEEMRLGRPVKTKETDVSETPAALAISEIVVLFIFTRIIQEKNIELKNIGFKDRKTIDV